MKKKKTPFPDDDLIKQRLFCPKMVAHFLCSFCATVFEAQHGHIWIRMRRMRKWRNPINNTNSMYFTYNCITVSEVPKLITKSVGCSLEPPKPHRLSPEKDTIPQAFEKPYLVTKYSFTHPSTVEEGHKAPSLLNKSGALYSDSAFSSNCCVCIFKRFIPAASDTSVAAYLPRNILATALLSNCMRSVEWYTWGYVRTSLAIWLPEIFRDSLNPWVEPFIWTHPPISLRRRGIREKLKSPPRQGKASKQMTSRKSPPNFFRGLRNQESFSAIHWCAADKIRKQLAIHSKTLS